MFKLKGKKNNENKRNDEEKMEDITTSDGVKFEDVLIPEDVRWAYALGNVASDYELGWLEGDRLATAKLMYPGFEGRSPISRIGFLNLMLPVGCNATCPKFCYIGHKRTEGITYKRISRLIKEFAKAGGKLIRIVGDGEPTLYPHFNDLCCETRKNEIALVVFTNGVGRLPKNILDEYARGDVYFYVKLWSENQEKQTSLVCPKKDWAYQYLNGALGPAPFPFYQLYGIDRNRVGFQTMVSTLNEEDAQAIMNGPKKNCPIWVEVMIPAGYGISHPDLAIVKGDFPRDCTHGGTPRGGYMTTVNSLGFLQAGIFVPEEAVDIRERNLMKIWKQIFIKNDLFFESRYTRGCFCRRMAAK